MEPSNLHFGGGASESVLHPVILALMLASIVLLWTVPRRLVALPFLWPIILSPIGQQLYQGGLHWSVARIMVLSAVARLAFQKCVTGRRLFPSGLNALDG